MPVFEWSNEGQAGRFLAFVNVAAGLYKTATPGRKPVENERKVAGEARRNESTPRAEVEKLQARAERAEKELGESRQQLVAFKRNRFRLPNPDSKQDRIETFKSLITPLQGNRLLDLGCGHGKFSLAAASLGWEVTAVDARTERMPVEKAENIEWVQSDVREYVFGKGDFDCISVLGLLYHLGQPDQMSLLSRCAGTLTILDTRIGLNQQAEENGYRGEYYDEPGGTEEERKAFLKASWGNARSFWPTEEYLIRMVRDAGFSLVAPVRPPRQKYRTFYVCYP